MSISREMLAAYADGELGPGDAAQVEAAIAADPALAREVEAHRALRKKLGAHFAPILDMPVPESLKRPLETSAQVVDLAAARRTREEKVITRFALPRWITAGAMAASLVVGLLVGTRLSDAGMIVSKGGELVASGALDKALTTQLASAQKEDAPVRILLSFKSGDGQYCRGFEMGTTSGIVCRTDGNWNLVRTQSGGAAPTTQYRQAGSAASEIMAMAQEMAAGDALDADAERAARAAGWRD